LSLLLSYYLSTCLSWSFVLRWFCTLIWVTKILMRAMSNVHAGRRFHTPGFNYNIFKHSSLYNVLVPPDICCARFNCKRCIWALTRLLVNAGLIHDGRDLPLTVGGGRDHEVEGQVRAIVIVVLAHATAARGRQTDGIDRDLKGEIQLCCQRYLWRTALPTAFYIKLFVFFPLAFQGLKDSADYLLFPQSQKTFRNCEVSRNHPGGGRWPGEEAHPSRTVKN